MSQGDRSARLSGMFRVLFGPARRVKAVIIDPLGIGAAIEKAFEETAVDGLDPTEPCEVEAEGTFARFHSRAHGDPGRLHTLFVDSDEKRHRAERYASARLHCGHFFASDAEGARSEAAYYDVDLRSRFLLELRLELSGVLDLTNHWALQHTVESAGLVPADREIPYRNLLLLLDQTRGGNALTDEIGAQAFIAGHRGIRFIGARALRDMELHEMTHTWMDIPGWTDQGQILTRLRRQPAVNNLVVFKAADVIRHTKAHRVDGGVWRENPLMGVDESSVIHTWKRDGLPTPLAADPTNWERLSRQDRTFKSTYLRKQQRDDQG